MHFNEFVNDFNATLLSTNGFTSNPTLSTSNLQLPEIYELYIKAKTLDRQSQIVKSNDRLVEALIVYKELLTDHGSKLNDTIFKEVAERCVERMRFIGRLKAAVDIHKKLIERFEDEPEYRNQLAVTYLLGNQ